MLKKINEGRVESDQGFSVHIIGLEILRYEEHGRSFNIEWNYDPASRKTYVYLSDVNVWEKPIKTNMSNEEKNEITTNLIECLKMLGGNFEIV